MKGTLWAAGAIACGFFTLGQLPTNAAMANPDDANLKMIVGGTHLDETQAKRLLGKYHHDFQAIGSEDEKVNESNAQHLLPDDGNKRSIAVCNFSSTANGNVDFEIYIDGTRRKAIHPKTCREFENVGKLDAVGGTGASDPRDGQLGQEPWWGAFMD